MPFLPHSNSSYVRSSLKGSECFSAADADITFQSSDGILFSIHKTNLIVMTGGFPPPEFHSPEDGAIPLPEPSGTLEILFQFLYPERHPKLAESMPFHLLDAVTEAAEKYQVFVAMDACEALMRKTLPWHADRIFLYAVKHGYNDLVDLAAIPLLDYPFEETLKGLPNDLICPWKNLEVNAASFPPSEFHNDGDGAVALPEPCLTLELVFKFLYPERRSKIESSTSFELLDAVAEAAEKYQVFAAMDACEILMRNTLPQNADRILLYAVKHGYNDIVDAAAIPLLDHPFEEVMNKLPNSLIRPWATHHQKWTVVQQKACTWPIITHYVYYMDRSECANVTSQLENTVTAMSSPTLLSRISSTYGTQWRQYIDSHLQTIPKFSVNGMLLPQQALDRILKDYIKISFRREVHMGFSTHLSNVSSQCDQKGDAEAIVPFAGKARRAPPPRVVVP
ncbi:hypothetical protein D9615_006290 [Tricholomella constricta]|uniref:BTB domain-containing protein n=1 Tax=Tricholomella constricta TaxID=117010 RepID=A0A8H5M3Z5_9AGAR|nr:hypothetical protein D9615_006290 [Tricholomella constricta]